MTIRNMMVVRAPSTSDCPMVRIANRTLEQHGFKIGVPVEIVYKQNILTLKVIDHANTIQKSPSPVALSTASSADTEERDGHTGRVKSDSTDTRQVVPNPTSPMRWVLSGQWGNGDVKDAGYLNR